MLNVPRAEGYQRRWHRAADAAVGRVPTHRLLQSHAPVELPRPVDHPRNVHEADNGAGADSSAKAETEVGVAEGL